MVIKKLTPNLAVNDITQTVTFYTKNLGFELLMAVPESQDGIENILSSDKNYVYALMKRDGVELMFQGMDTFQQDIVFARGLEIGGCVSFYMEVENIAEIYQAIQAKSIPVSELKTTWYGMREFYVQDLNGYILGFAENQA